MNVKFVIWCSLALLTLSACGSSVFDPNLAAHDAQYQAERYAVMATGTAEAQSLPYTQSALALQIAQTQDAATLWAGGTKTALSWTPTPIPTATLMPTATKDLPGTLAAAAVIATTTATYQRTQRDEMVNTIKAIFWYGLGIVTLLLLVPAAYMLIKKFAMAPHQVTEQGRIIPMVNVVDGIAFDIERSANGVIGVTQKFLKQLPAITAERQDQVTRMSQIMDLATRRALPQKLVDNIMQPAGLLPPPVDVETNFLLPAWELINSWDGKGLPYYTARGLEIIDTNRFPHLAAVGATGTGKSRRFFRPMIACVLASGHRAVIIGKSTDYWPFEAHPNVALLTVNKITERGQAERYARILEAIVAEMNRRDDVLTRAHRSTWADMGRSLTYIVLDELGNALRLMDKDTSNQSRIWVEGLVSEGRKFGFNIVISNQRATGMASILSQTGKAIFRVETDEERAHKSLAGASMLHEGYYLAKFGIPQLAGGFEPTDEQIQKFLASRPVDKVDDESEWIDAIVSDAPPSLPAEPRKPALPRAMTGEEFLASLTEQQYRIVTLYLDGWSHARIEREVYGKIGGNAYYEVDKVIRGYKAVNTSTSTPKPAVLGTSTA